MRDKQKPNDHHGATETRRLHRENLWKGKVKTYSNPKNQTKTVNPRRLRTRRLGLADEFFAGELEAVEVAEGSDGDLVGLKELVGHLR